MPQPPRALPSRRTSRRLRLNPNHEPVRTVPDAIRTMAQSHQPIGTARATVQPESRHNARGQRALVPGQSPNRVPGTSAHGEADSPWNGSRQLGRRSKKLWRRRLNSSVWPRRTSRSLSSRSQDRECSASGEVAPESGRGCGQSSRGRRGHPIDPGPEPAAPSVGIVAKARAPRALRASQPVRPKVTNGGLQHVVRLDRVRTVLELAL